MDAATLLESRQFLVVDDDPLVLAICRDRLERAGAQAFTADSCAEGLELALQQPMHFVLLDLSVGDRVVSVDLVGEFQQRLRTIERRVILHSAVSATELYRQAHNLCALGAVQKTGDERIFLHRLERLVELSLAIAKGATDRPSVPY